MRFTRFSGIVATTALGAATVLGGAGIAQAQSSGSLGSLTAGSSAEETPAPLVLDLADAGKDGANGTLTNNTEDSLSCYVAVTTAEKAAEAEELLAPDDAVLSLSVLQELVQGAPFGFVAAPVEAENSAEWTVAVNGAEKDFRAGAMAICDPTGDAPSYAFDYEDEDEDEAANGSLGNVLGSLGSSKDDAPSDDAPATDDKKAGSLGNIFGSSNGDDDKTPA